MVLAAAVIALAPAESRAQDPARGIVTKVSGPWTIAGIDTQLKVGDLLYGEPTLAIPRTTSGGIEIVMFDNGLPWRQQCSTTAPCDGIYKREWKANQPQRTGFWAFFTDYWHSSRVFPPVFAAVRGGAVRLPPTVVPAGRRVDLTAMTVGIDADVYTIHLAPAPGAPTAIAKPVTAVIRRISGQEVSMDGPTAGLYLVTISGADGRMIGGPTVMLVSTNAAAVNAHIAELTSAMAAWSDVTDTTRDQMIIRALYALAGDTPSH